MKKAFYCHSQGCFVVCQAPFQCFDKCNTYRAQRVTGVKKRNKGTLQNFKTGYIQGNELVSCNE